ncbi:MAG TPA: sodium:proton antiporter [Alphaproteobacteria bacterium]|nr:sodium:proton antiporter [Alphaproteobacteria bacterium]
MGVFTAIACLFGIVAILSFVNERWLRVQSDIGLLLLAVVLAGGLRLIEMVVPVGLVGALHQLTQYFNLNDTLLKGVLCFLLFRGSTRVRWAALRAQRWLVLSLAFAATAIACFVTGGLVFAGVSLFGISMTLTQALLFGALIAATDPVAALSILSKVGLPENLETVVDGESLLNDGVAVVLFTIFADMALGGSASATGAGAVFLQEVLGGAVIGVLGWLVLHVTLPRATTYCTSLLISLAAVSCLYAGAQYIHVSGPIATVVAGLLTGNVTGSRVAREVLDPLATFWQGLDEVLNALLFVFVGLHVILINPLESVPTGIPGSTAIVAVLVGRAIAVFAVVGGLDAVGRIRADRWGLTKLLTWGGLRGGLSLALAVSLPDSSWKPILLNMTFAVVVFSIIVQGLTIRRMFSREQLEGLLRS